MSSSGLACAGCHPDGRDDGLTWFLRDEPRQTPTLSGQLEYLFNWNGANDSLAESVARTLHRLGGTGLPREEHNALVAWVLRGPVVPPRGAQNLDAREARGRALFGGDAGCDGCHDPARNFTDAARDAVNARWETAVGRRPRPPCARHGARTSAAPSWCPCSVVAPIAAARRP